MHLARHVATATQANKQTEQSSAPKSPAEKSRRSQSGEVGEVSKAWSSSITAPASSPMSKVVNVLADIIQNHELEDTIRQKITEAIGYTREEPVGQAKVGATRDNIRHISKPARNFFDLYELVQAHTSPKSGKSL
jgi:hypothetical protein